MTLQPVLDGGMGLSSDAHEETAPASIRATRARASDVRSLSPPPAAASSLSPESAAKRLIDALIERGVDTFFGIPGGPICPVFEAIRCTPRAKLVESRHETHAAFAAALYYRASGRVPALVVTSGPGVTNAVTGIASASLERIPMLVIVGDVAWATTGGCLAQDSGPEGLAMESILGPITRAQVRAAGARSVVSQAMSALDAACNPLHPGPALFAVAIDHAMAACAPTRVNRLACSIEMPAPSDAIACTAEWIAGAGRPLVVIGAGCRGHEESVRRLVDALAVPFVTTPRAKGLVPETHPYSLRNGGIAASLWARRYTASPVDGCVALGTDLDDSSMGPTPYLGDGGRLVHVDLDARVFGRNLPTALGVAADLGAFARALANHASTRMEMTPKVHAAFAEARSAAPFDVADPLLDPGSPVPPHRIVAELERAAGPGARFVTDIGEHMLFALHYLTAKAEDCFYVQLNLGSMGSGIAGSIGLALADPTRRVVCIAGDGGMQMAGMEALVAVRERLPVLFAVINDGRYNMVHHGMQQIFGVAAPYDSPPIDFAAWARALSIPSAIVSEGGELTPDLVDALLASGGPALLDIRADASVRIRGGGRVEALQQMSMLSIEPEGT